MSVVSTLAPACPTVNFNKYEWENRFRRALGSGLSWKAAALAMTFRATLGTASTNCHIPLVWRRASTLSDLCGMAPKTFRRYRDALADAGFLFEIASGHGSRQTIIVLKLPTWTEADALQIARRAFAAYCERTETHHLGWIDSALTYAIENRAAAASATRSDEPEPIEETRSDEPEPIPTRAAEQKGSPPGAKGKASPLPPLYKEKTMISGVVGRLSGSVGDESTSPPPSANDKKQGSNSSTVIDFDRLRELRLTLLAMFAEVGRALDEGAAMHLARVYGRRGADAEALRDTLELKLLRLVGDGYGTGKVAALIAEDAAEWSPPPPPARQNRPSNTARDGQNRPENVAAMDRNDHQNPFWLRYSELEQEHGDDLATIHQALSDEFGDVSGYF